MIKVVSNIECFDTNHEVPRVISIESSDKYNQDEEWVELNLGTNNVYRVKAQDLHDAIDNATRNGR